MTAAVVFGLASQPPQAAAAPAPSQVVWPVPVPGWFWEWARWYLGRGEFAGEPRSASTRPDSAPRAIPPWAWHRLAYIVGVEPPPLPKQSLAPGSSGRQVADLQRALRYAGYPVGPVDGDFGPKTQAAVITFEKVHRLRRDGVVTPAEYRLVLKSGVPSPPMRGSRYVYVDLARQVLFEVHSGRVTHVFPVSTGGGYTYRSQNGSLNVARTPTGSYRVYRKATGWETSYLGELYYPSYFVGGYAIHGSRSVPATPVSHGCVRIPLWVSVAFYKRNPVGTLVVVR